MTSGSIAWRPPAKGAITLPDSLDERKLAAVLPDRERLALLDADFERVGIDLADRGRSHPGQLGDRSRAPPRHRSRSARSSRRGRAAPECRSPRSRGGRRPRPRRWRSRAATVTAWRDRRHLAAEIGAVEAGRPTRKRRRDRGRNSAAASKSPSPRRDEQARRPAQQARQHECVAERDRPNAGRRSAPRLPASALTSTQTRSVLHHPTQQDRRTNAPPAAAISGTSDVGVMPGCVLTSSQMISPFSEWRSS